MGRKVAKRVAFTWDNTEDYSAAFYIPPGAEAICLELDETPGASVFIQRYIGTAAIDSTRADLSGNAVLGDTATAGWHRMCNAGSATERNIASGSGVAGCSIYLGNAHPTGCPVGWTRLEKNGWAPVAALPIWHMVYTIEEQNIPTELM